MTLSWQGLLDVIFGLLPDLVREWLTSRRAKKEKKAKNEKELNDAIDSGDPDAIAHRKRLRDQK